MWTAFGFDGRMVENDKGQRAAGLRGEKTMKKRTVLTGMMLLGVALCGCGANAGDSAAVGSGEDDTLIVFNYGDYIDRNVLDLFEQETGIKVKYEEYVTPEDMYTKYQSGAINYDLICTSDYMVEKMILAGEVQEIDTTDMEYYDNLDPKYLEFCRAFDPENKYAVPYFWGTVGICYNTEMVDEEVDSWDILWNPKYSDQIIMENSMRDAFIAPLKLMGESINTTDKNLLVQAQQKLFDQKKNVMAYLVDESRDAMISGDAAMAMIYSGDATAAMEANDALDYCVPKEGSNIWFDCFMIPKTAKHKKAAEKFIDFMNREDIGMMNFDYIYYATPNMAVYDALDEETKEDYTIFPDQEILDKCEVYKYLGEEDERYYSQLWKELKSY